MTTPPAEMARRIEALSSAKRRKIEHAIEQAEGQDFDDFVQRVHSLPPELFEKIKEYTCLIERRHVKLDEHDKPPAVLHINRTIRCKLLKLYYKGCIFEAFDEEVLVRWLKSLDGYAKAFLREIRYDIQLPYHGTSRHNTSSTDAKARCLVFLQRLKENGILFRINLLYVKSPRPGNEGWSWTNPLLHGDEPRRDASGFLV